MSRARHGQNGSGHEDNRYDGKPPMIGGLGTSGHPVKHKRADGGSVPATPARKRGGKAPMAVGGMSSKHLRLDRRGRKRGGAVGADSSPLTQASRLSGPEGGSTDNDGDE